jgi:hypothetical protein
VAFTNGAWMWWETLGGVTTSEPTVRNTSRGAELFARGLNGTIVNMPFPGGMLP